MYANYISNITDSAQKYSRKTCVCNVMDDGDNGTFSVPQKEADYLCRTEAQQVRVRTRVAQHF